MFWLTMLYFLAGCNIWQTNMALLVQKFGGEMLCQNPFMAILGLK